MCGRLAIVIAALVLAGAVLAADPPENVARIGHVGGAALPIVVDGDRVYCGVGPRVIVVSNLTESLGDELGRSGPAPGWIADLDVIDGLAYLAAADAGLRILDIADPSAITELGFVDFPGNAQGVAVLGDHAYVADGVAGLRVFDVHEPASPVEVALVAIDDGIPNHIAAAAGHVFLAAGSGGLVIFDVSDPAAPVEVAIVGLSAAAEFVEVVGTLAYVANDFAGLHIVDVGNPAQPVSLSQFDTPGFALGVAIEGDRAYVADGDVGARIVDVSNPAQPVDVGVVPPPDTTLTLSVGAGGGYLWVSRGPRGLLVYDLAEPIDPVPVVTKEEPGFAQGLAVAGSHVLVASDNGGLWGVDVTVASDPVPQSRVETPGSALDVVVVGTVAYLADGYSGMAILDVADPSLPVEIGRVDTQGFVWALDVSGTTAYLADGQEGVRVIDVADPQNPVELSFLLTAGPALDLAVDGSVLYVSTFDQGMRILDVSAPTPVEIGSYEPADAVTYGIAAPGSGHVYVAAPGKGLVVLDVSDPSQPIVVGSALIELGYELIDVALSGDFAFVTAGRLGLRVMDVSDPALPRQLGSYDTAGHAFRIFIDGEFVYVADQVGGLYVLDFDENSMNAPTGPLNFGISPGGHLSWSPGIGQTGYAVARYALFSGEIRYFPANGVPLPTEVTEFTDPLPRPEPIYCYWLLGLNGADVVGTSDFLCELPNAPVIPGVPESGLTLRLNQTPLARVSWDPANAWDGGVVVGVPLDGSETSIQMIGSDQSLVVLDTVGKLTCYYLTPIVGSQVGRTGSLCALPGLSN